MPQWRSVDGTEALSMLLKRFAYVSIWRYGSSIRETSSTIIMDYIFDHYSHLLTHLNQPCLSRNSLRHFAAAIHDEGGPLENCWGFIDGTVRPINQSILI